MQCHQPDGIGQGSRRLSRPKALSRRCNSASCESPNGAKPGTVPGTRPIAPGGNAATESLGCEAPFETGFPVFGRSAPTSANATTMKNALNAIFTFLFPSGKTTKRWVQACGQAVNCQQQIHSQFLPVAASSSAAPCHHDLGTDNGHVAKLRRCEARNVHVKRKRYRQEALVFRASRSPACASYLRHDAARRAAKFCNQSGQFKDRL